jgi:hypothetical protein
VLHKPHLDAAIDPWIALLRAITGLDAVGRMGVVGRRHGVAFPAAGRRQREESKTPAHAWTLAQGGAADGVGPTIPALTPR